MSQYCWSLSVIFMFEKISRKSQFISARSSRTSRLLIVKKLKCISIDLCVSKRCRPKSRRSNFYMSLWQNYLSRKSQLPTLRFCEKRKTRIWKLGIVTCVILVVIQVRIISLTWQYWCFNCLEINCLHHSAVKLPHYYALCSWSL